jgi:sulfite reductase beta subunit-like hemoprotein
MSRRRYEREKPLGLIERQDLEALRRLVGEVMGWHADPDSPDYNACDTSPCDWCRRAYDHGARPVVLAQGRKNANERRRLAARLAEGIFTSGPPNPVKVDRLLLRTTSDMQYHGSWSQEALAAWLAKALRQDAQTTR